MARRRIRPDALVAEEPAGAAERRQEGVVAVAAALLTA
jgi:hypothetical protein